MTQQPFYSRSRQLARVIRSDWRLHGLDAAIGILYVLLGFYFLSNMNAAQVREIVAPFVILAWVMAYLTHRTCTHEALGPTAPYFRHLPRTRTCAWDGHFLFLCLVAAALEGVILIGSWLKLGGSYLLPQSRFHPELVALPFLAILLTMRIAHTSGYWKRRLQAWSIIVLAAALSSWELVSEYRLHPSEANYYWPPREIPLSLQCALTAGLSALALFLYLNARRNWLRAEEEVA